MVWIIVAVVAVALAVWALWPRKGGVVDRRAFRAEQLDKGRAANYDQHGRGGPSDSGALGP